MDIISLTGENFKTIYRSPLAERITGLTNEERVRVGYIDLVHPDDKERMKESLKDVLSQPKVSIPAYNRTRHKKGHFIWLEGMMTNKLMYESIKAVVINPGDLTENKKVQDLLQASENRFRCKAVRLYILLFFISGCMVLIEDFLRYLCLP